MKKVAMSELSYATRKLDVRTAVVNLSRPEWKKVARLMEEWNMDFSEFCEYAVKQIADTHQSKRKDAASRH